MRVGIVGNGTDKFTREGKRRARDVICELLSFNEAVLVSGHSPVGGIDIWAEEVAEQLGRSMDIKVPEIQQWNPSGYGYKARNLDIARTSDVVHVILADVYPEEYAGRRFDLCYHCGSNDHVKSGGCWTGKQAIKAGVPAHWRIVNNY